MYRRAGCRRYRREPGGSGFRPFFYEASASRSGTRHVDAMGLDWRQRPASSRSLSWPHPTAIYASLLFQLVASFSGFLRSRALIPISYPHMIMNSWALRGRQSRPDFIRLSISLTFGDTSMRSGSHREPKATLRKDSPKPCRSCHGFCNYHPHDSPKLARLKETVYAKAREEGTRPPDGAPLPT